MEIVFARTTATVKNYFTVYEVEHFTGFSKWMLDYLARENIFTPSVSQRDKRGVLRRYSYTDVVFLRALATICHANGKIRHLTKSLLNLRGAVGTLEPGTRPERFLFVEGSELCLRTPDEGAMVLRTGQMLLASIVDLHDVTDVICDGIILYEAGQFRLTERAHDEAERIRRGYWERCLEARQQRQWRESLLQA